MNIVDDEYRRMLSKGLKVGSTTQFKYLGCTIKSDRESQANHVIKKFISLAAQCRGIDEHALEQIINTNIAPQFKY